MNTFYFRAFATVVIQPQRETKHQTTACSLTPVGMSERIRRAKARKLVDWDNGSLIGKANTAHTSKAKQGIHSSLPIGRQGVQPSLRKHSSIVCNCYLGRQTPSLQTSPPSFFSPLLSMLSKTSYGMGYPSGQLGSAVLAVSPPNSVCILSPLAGRVVWEAEKTLALCKQCSAITKTSLYYQHCFQHISRA